MTFYEFIKFEGTLFLLSLIFFIAGVLLYRINFIIKNKANNGYKYTFRMMMHNSSDFFIKLWWFMNAVMVIIAILYVGYITIQLISRLVGLGG